MFIESTKARYQMLIAGGDENGWSPEDEADEEEWRSRGAVDEVDVRVEAPQAQDMGQEAPWARGCLGRGTFFPDCHCRKHLMWF
jgi:hypothetical protein